MKQLLPERLEDFRECYKNRNSKAFVINDFLNGFSTIPIRSQKQVFKSRMILQLGILGAACEILASSLRDIRTVIRSEVFDDDLEVAGELVKQGHIRSAGVICGVVLEGHFKSVAARRSITIAKKNQTLATLNDAMKDNSVYDVVMWRSIQKLADIRNLCGHAGEREPTRDEVDDLIRGTDRVIKEVF